MARGAAERRRAGRDKRHRSRLRRANNQGKAIAQTYRLRKKQAFGAFGARSNGLRWGVEKAEAVSAGSERDQSGADIDTSAGGQQPNRTSRTGARAGVSAGARDRGHDQANTLRRG